MGTLKIEHLRTFLFTITILVGPAVAPCPGQSLEKGQIAPPFTAKDANGKSLSWDQWENMAVILIFHSEHIMYSERGLRAIIKDLSTEKELGGKAAILLITSGKRDLGTLTRVLEQSGLSFSITVDPERKNFARYRVVAFPTVYVIDKNRKIVHIDKGFGPLLPLKVTAAAKLAAGLIDEKAFYAATTKSGSGKSDHNALKLARTLRMVRQLIAAGMYTQARSSLEKVITKDTDSVEAAAMLTKVLLIQKRTKQAEPWLRRVRELAPGTPTLHLLEARFAIEEGRPEECLKKLEGMDGRKPEIALLRGLAFEMKKDFKAAAAAYRKALQDLQGALK